MGFAMVDWIRTLAGPAPHNPWVPDIRSSQHHRIPGLVDAGVVTDHCRPLWTR